VSSFPTSFHIGPLVFHIYGFGLAIAAYIAYIYAEKRISKAQINSSHFASFASWLIVSGLVGARLANIATNWSYYSGNIVRCFAIWQGGLSSFGGIALAIPIGIVLKRKYWPEISLATYSDALIPALIAGWALGRVLGPQFMVAGGGHITNQWFGIHYSGQIGRRVPVPLIQGAEDALLWLALITESKFVKRPGVLTGTGLIIWGIVRAIDEKMRLGQQSHSGSLGVQIAGLVLSAAGLVILFSSLRTEKIN
jgi:phosphatidylglycerol:prolipoprotein diacylglycerol transferase